LISPIRIELKVGELSNENRTTEDENRAIQQERNRGEDIKALQLEKSKKRRNKNRSKVRWLLTVDYNDIAKELFCVNNKQKLSILILNLHGTLFNLLFVLFA